VFRRCVEEIQNIVGTNNALSFVSVTNLGVILEFVFLTEQFYSIIALMTKQFGRFKGLFPSSKSGANHQIILEPLKRKFVILTLKFVQFPNSIFLQIKEHVSANLLQSRVVYE
jgi:hypothetical protein